MAAILVSASSIAGAVAWQGPPPSPPPEPLPAEVKLELYSDQLSERWAWTAQTYPDAVMPAISLDEEVREDNWESTLAGCYRDAGFEVTGSFDRGWSMDPPADIPPMDSAVAVFECEARFPWEGTLDALMSDVEFDALYDYYLHQLSPCLRLVGAPSSARAPSRDSFVDPVTRYPTWSPYAFGSGGDLTAVEWDDLQRRCPSAPPWQRSPS